MFYRRAMELFETLVSHRRYLHRNPEIHNDLPITTAYVEKQLKSFGYEPRQICRSGLEASLGEGDKCLLIRADMDALPFGEESGESFASGNGYMHACGHDLHTAMLLGAAQMLKEREGELKTKVKFMFQPGEETSWGAKAMIEAGILENPRVDAALACHVKSSAPWGTLFLTSGPVMASSDTFAITIHGKGAHGAMPQRGVDPINAGVHIHLALQALISREISFLDGAVLSIGSFQAGSAPNVIPETAILQGTVRSFSESTRQFVIERVREIAVKTAETFRARADFEVTSSTPVLLNDPEITAPLETYIKNSTEIPLSLHQTRPSPGSEDFAFVAQKVPSAMFFLGAASKAGGETFSHHHPRVVFDENVLPLGAALFAGAAFHFLA